MYLASPRSFGLAAGLLVSTALVPAAVAEPPGRIEILLRTGDAAPGLPGTVIDRLRAPRFNGAGQIYSGSVLQAGPGGVTPDTRGVVWIDDTVVARTGDTPGGVPGGRLVGFGSFAANDAGDVAYVGTLAAGEGGVTSLDDTGIWRNQTLLVREGSEAPQSPGAEFRSFLELSLADDGRPLYLGTLRTGVGGVTANNNIGIWFGDSLIARTGGPAPAALPGAVIVALEGAVLNRSNQIAYHAQLQTGVGGVTSADSQVILRAGEVVQRTGFGATGTNGAVFSALSMPTLSNSSIGYVGGLAVGVGDTTADNNAGIWQDNRLVVRRGDIVPGSTADERFRDFSLPAINDLGVSAFLATFTEGLGGPAPAGNRGLWMYGANGDRVEVVRVGDSFDGRVVDAVSIDAQAALNRWGQFGYLVGFTDGTEAMAVYTPDLAWRSGGSGFFGDPTNWTLGLSPGPVHDVTIAPGSDAVVGGFLGDRELRSLTLGGGLARATLAPTGGRIVVADGFEIGTNGRLTGSATFGGTIRNHGEIVAEALGVDGTVENFGIIRGAAGADDRLGGTVLNRAGGLVDVRPGESLHLTGGAENRGETRVIAGRLRSTGPFENTVEGVINGRDATLDFAGGVKNAGELRLSFGVSDIFGRVENAGRIVQSGNSAASFWDDLVNTGEVRVALGSNIVLFGDLFGTGSFTGGGGVFLEGGVFSPGTSPGIMRFDNLDMSAAGGSEIFIGGTLRGLEHSGADVVNELVLGGTLRVVLGDGFLPVDGDAFELFRAGRITGAFAGFDLPGLGGAAWEVLQDETRFTLVVRGDGVGVIPLPAAGWLLLGGLGALSVLGARRRRVAG